MNRNIIVLHRVYRDKYLRYSIVILAQDEKDSFMHVLTLHLLTLHLVFQTFSYKLYFIRTLGQ